MFRGIDHLVIACPDPDAAAAAVESQLGIAVTGGGRHEGLGTHNRLAFLADGSYLELIGVTDRERAMRSAVGRASVRTLDAAGGGLATYAIGVDDVEAAAPTLPAYGPVTHGSRRRDDGELVEWWTAFPLVELGPEAPPFLIQHAHVGAEWGPEALADRARFVHPIGSPVSLSSVGIATLDPSSLAAELNQALNVEFRTEVDRAVAQVASHGLGLIASREMAVAATVTLGARVGAVRSSEILGIRFDIEAGGISSQPLS